MLNPKLETPCLRAGSKQTQVSKAPNLRVTIENPKLPFEFWVLDLPALLSMGLFISAMISIIIPDDG